MGRVQEPSTMKMRGQLRSQSDVDGAPLSRKRRKTGQENDKASKEPDFAGGRADPTPLKDRRPWTHEEEMNLVKVLLEHKREGKMIPLQSKIGTYWTDLISLLYPGDKGITERRLYDKVRRMHHRYHEILEKKTSYRNAREKELFEFWEKLFVDDIDTKKAVQEAETEKDSNVNRVKLVEVSDSSEEDEDEDDHDDERVPPANDIPKAGPSAQEFSGSEEEDEEEDEKVDEDEDDDEDETSPEKGRPVHSRQNVARAEATRAAQEELRRTAPLAAEETPKAVSKMGLKQSGRSEKGSLPTERLPNVENGEGRSKRGAEQARSKADMIRSLKVELFEYVQNLRNDCMRELDVVRGQLMSPARLQLAKRQQELIMEELSLQEKELDISRRFCRLQKEALKLQNAS